MKRTRGFSLIELAIVLVIVTLLIGGLAVPLTAQIQARRIAETKKTLEEAREAVLGYAMTHPATAPATNRHLPCPDTDDDGVENRDAVDPDACAAHSGWFPWVTLGTAPQDAWGNRLRYGVVRDFTRKDSGFSASSPPPPPGFDPLMICTTRTCTPPHVASDVVFALLSDGPNSKGSRNVNVPLGTATPAPPGIGADESENQNGDSIYVSRAPYKPADSSVVEAAKEFDDLVVWVSHAHLIARVCPTGCSP